MMKHFTKFLVISFMVIFLAVPLMSYAKEAGDAKPIVLKFGSWVGAKAVFAQAKEWYLAEVEKRTNGRVKFERYWSGSLAPDKELLEAVEAGVADVGTVLPAYYPGKLPLGTVSSIPLVWENIYEFGMAINDLYQEVPELKKEMAKYGARFLTPAPTSQYGIVSVPKLESLADLKGKKVRAVGHQATLIHALGGVPVSMPAPETYTAMERGTVDAVAFSPSAITAYGIESASKYYWNVPTGGHGPLLAINEKVWNKLPPDIRKIMEEVALEHPKHYHQIYQIDGDGASLKKMQSVGVQFIVASDSVKAEVKKVAKQVIWDKWVEDMEAKGLPGRKVLDKLIELVEKYKAQSPFK